MRHSACHVKAGGPVFSAVPSGYLSTTLEPRAIVELILQVLETGAGGLLERRHGCNPVQVGRFPVQNRPFQNLPGFQVYQIRRWSLL